MFSPVTQYETIDGKKHDTVKLAKEHSEDLICEKVGKMLNPLAESGKLTNSQLYKIVTTMVQESNFRTFQEITAIIQFGSDSEE